MKGRVNVLVMSFVLVALMVAMVVAIYWNRTGSEPAGQDDTVAAGDFHGRIKAELARRHWKDYQDYKMEMSLAEMKKSLAMGVDFLLANQKPEGNFNYLYDWINKKQDPSDNQVRQAGALWGISLIYNDRPSEATQRALDKAFDFFFEHTQVGPDGSLIVVYPGERDTGSGTVALVAMAIVDYLRVNPPISSQRRSELETKLDGYLKFLVWMQMENGHISKSYDYKRDKRIEFSSPYYDGETLLCLTKAAKYLNRGHLIPVIERAAAAMARTYAFAWQDDGKPDRTKGFYQWGSMSFWEIQDAGWKDGELYADLTLMLANWMIRTHRTLSRARNTAYAHEALTHAYQIAEKRGDKRAASELRRTVDQAMLKLCSWQVNGPLADRNSFLRDNPTDDPLARGGFMNHRSEAPLRIDVTQHQSHAMILALRYVYR